MNSRRLIIRNGHVWTPEGFIDGGTVVVEGERIADVLDHSEDRGAPADETVDATGLTVLPGLIDTHSHHREPGFAHKEDILCATRAAAAGGVTVTVGMPNVNPAVTDVDLYRSTLDLYAQKAVVDYNLHPAPTNVSQVGDMAELGCLGFKVFMVVDTKRSYPHMPGLGVVDEGELLEIFEAVHATGRPLLVHPHNQEIMTVVEQRYWQRGDKGPLAYVDAQRTYNGLIWDTAISTLLLLQEAVGTRLHVLHLVTKKSLDLVAAAKAAGRSVTSEVNGFALFLGSRSLIEERGPRVLGRWVPDDVKDALWRGMSTGDVDVIGTDHAPHTLEEKEPGWSDMWAAPSGVPQLQDCLTQLLEKGVHSGKISLDDAVRATSLNPARIFGLYPRKGTIEPGADADLVLVDLDREIEFRDENALSKCGWTPYHGDTARGVPIHTILRGQFVMRDRQVVGVPGQGTMARPVAPASAE